METETEREKERERELYAEPMGGRGSDWEGEEREMEEGCSTIDQNSTLERKRGGEEGKRGHFSFTKKINLRDRAGKRGRPKDPIAIA